MTFDEFWLHLRNLGPTGGRCSSQGRGTPVNYQIENGQLVYQSDGRAGGTAPARTNRNKAKEYFDILQGGLRRFGGAGGFRYDHSAWFHDIYAAVTGDTRR